MKKARAEFKKGIHGTDPILTDGIPQVAFVGRSNVGKSSLISTLIGVPGLVRISDTPGRTTEINFFLVDGAYYLVDLPGYGYARLSEKERAHIKDLIIWYVSASGAQPKLFVVVLDAKVGLTDFDKDMIYMLESEGHPYGARTMQLQATDASSTVATTTCAASIAQPVPTIVSFFANPLTIFAGGTTTLSWNVQNASSTSLSSPLGTGSVSASGTSVVSPGTTTTYILTAVNPGGTATTSAKVTVLPVNNGTTTPPASTTTVPIIRKPNLVISHNNHFVANNAIVTSVASTSFTAKIFGINVTVVSNKPVTVGNYVNVVGTLNPDTMTVTAKMVQQFASSKVVFNKLSMKEERKHIKEAIKDLKEQRKEQEKHIKETLKDLKEQLKFAKH